MKILYVFLLNISFIIINFNVFSQSIKDSCPKECKIIKISNINDAYLIYVFVKEVQEYYTIISLKTTIQESKKIRKGQHLKLILHSYFDYNIIWRHGTIYPVTINETTIFLKEDGRICGNIALTPNLQGLYYISP